MLLKNLCSIVVCFYTHALSCPDVFSGVVIVRSRCCSKLHLISDNLNWFGNSPQNIETILHEKGLQVQRGDIAPDSDLLEIDHGAFEAPPNPLEGHLDRPRS